MGKILPLIIGLLVFTAVQAQDTARGHAPDTVQSHVLATKQLDTNSHKQDTTQNHVLAKAKTMQPDTNVHKQDTAQSHVLAKTEVKQADTNSHKKDTVQPTMLTNTKKAKRSDTIAHAQKPKRVRQLDTAGLAAIENNMEDLKTITAAITENIDSCDNIDQIRRYANMIQQVDDTLQDHINLIFRGFNILHPMQYMPIKNISDLTQNMIDCKTAVKAKKVNQQIKTEYNNLLKAQ